MFISLPNKDSFSTFLLLITSPQKGIKSVTTVPCGATDSNLSFGFTACKNNRRDWINMSILAFAKQKETFLALDEASRRGHYKQHLHSLAADGNGVSTRWWKKKGKLINIYGVSSPLLFQWQMEAEPFVVIYSIMMTMMPMLNGLILREPKQQKKQLNGASNLRQCGINGQQCCVDVHHLN